VAIRVRVPVTVVAGQELEYRIIVENFSPAPAHHVFVRDPLPAKARFVRANPTPLSREPELLWQLGTLDAGAKREIVLILSPTGTGEVKNCARVQFEHGECVSTKVLRPSLSLRKTGPTQAVLNDSLTYHLTVTNKGDAEATNVLLTDALPAGLEYAGGRKSLTWEVGTLVPGQSQSVEYQVVARALGRLANKAVVTAAEGLREEIGTAVTVGEAKLSLAITGPKQRYLNAPASYQIMVSNPGTAPVHQVVIADPLPAQTALVSASPGGRLLDGQVQWTIGNLAPGDSRSVEVVLRALSVGRVCNRASASADRGLGKEAEVCTDFVGVPALSLEVGDTIDPVGVGGATSYHITVRNPGTTPATGVQVVATVPPEMVVTHAAGAADHRKEGQKILYNAVTVRAGGEARYRIDVKAQKAGDVRFKVELTADQLTAGPVLQEESTTIFASLQSSR
jgi:uncharacterized repeat protein (TIGR01451 family)